MKRRKASIPPLPIDTEFWLTNPDVLILPPHVKGLFMDLLCYMWSSPRRGIMARPDGKAYTKNEIMRLLAIIDDTPLERLINAGLLQVNLQGEYCNVKMMKSSIISAVRRMAGKKGGDRTKARLQNANPKKPEKVAKQEVTESVPEKPPERKMTMTPTPKKTKKKKEPKVQYAEFVSLTKTEYEKLLNNHSEEEVKGYIYILDNYKGSSGRTYKSDYRAILTWVIDAYNEKVKRYGTQWKAAYAGSGVTDNKGLSTATLQPVKGTGGVGGAETPQDYSERF